MKIGQIEFGEDVLTLEKMKAILPEEVYQSFLFARNGSRELKKSEKSILSSQIYTWAKERNAIYFAHSFRTFSGRAVERQTTILQKKEDLPLEQFTIKELFYEEPDASSFSCGGLRTTNHARGFALWDMQSPIYVKEGVLYIPSFLFGENGKILDEKKPYRNSEQCLSQEIVETLKQFGIDTTEGKVELGIEQEYFLLAKEKVVKRMDLMETGQTLFGTISSYVQEDAEHYFSLLPKEVSSFMSEVNETLWKLGIYAKSQHAEVAPHQYECSPIYTSGCLALEQNGCLMDVLKEVADRHDFVCLFKEKPFRGVNGSGKHHNYSLQSKEGTNLLVYDEHHPLLRRYLLTAFMKTLDEHSDLLRTLSSSSSNEERLGGHEAPPSILSMDWNPKESIETCDRNRTSPVVVLSNRVEFRMLGSSMIAYPFFTMWNTFLAFSLKQMREEMRKGKSILQVIEQEEKEHQRILFQGDGYQSSWKIEAEKRGLSSLSYEEGLKKDYEKEIEILESFHIYSREDFFARQKEREKQYQRSHIKKVDVFLRMLHREILPQFMEEYQKTPKDLDAQRKTWKKVIRTCFHLSNAIFEEKKKWENANEEEWEKIHHYIEKKMEEIRACVEKQAQYVDKRKMGIPFCHDILLS